jgi:hypothetical protein
MSRWRRVISWSSVGNRDRNETIAALLADTEPTTAYLIMRELLPDLPAAEMFPGMSEIIGHLDCVEDEGGLRSSTWTTDPGTSVRDRVRMAAKSGRDRIKLE